MQKMSVPWRGAFTPSTNSIWKKLATTSLRKNNFGGGITFGGGWGGFVVLDSPKREKKILKNADWFMSGFRKKTNTPGKIVKWNLKKKHPRKMNACIFQNVEARFFNQRLELGSQNTICSYNHHLLQMDVSKTSGTPKTSILIGFSIINHPFWGTTILGNIQIYPLGFLLIIYSICSLTNGPKMGFFNHHHHHPPHSPVSTWMILMIKSKYGSSKGFWKRNMWARRETETGSLRIPLKYWLWKIGILDFMVYDIINHTTG